MAKLGTLQTSLNTLSRTVVQFDEAKRGVVWKDVTLPHDFVVDLPFSADASHSHGYKTVGYKYPETSVETKHIT